MGFGLLSPMEVSNGSVNESCFKMYKNQISIFFLYLPNDSSKL